MRVRDYLRDRPRDLAIWSVGTNCALRAGDLLALKWSDLEDSAGRFAILLREKKTGKIRRIVLNLVASADLRAWKTLSTSDYVFSGQRGPLTVASVGRMLKSIACDAGVNAQRVSTHSLRKTWVRAQHEIHKVPLYILSQALGHASEAQTRVYMGLLADGVAEAYDNVIA
ncbi:tyrosine-type recombinase/integrase [Variovorax sp. LG9.2]|nr:tyrosine-type recombinase/integrase [Variovorax sp. LG9.2]